MVIANTTENKVKLSPEHNVENIFLIAQQFLQTLTRKDLLQNKNLP